jgi:molybdopterin synthase catalytic subunit
VADVSYRARLEPDTLHPDAELRAFLDAVNGDGAVVSFVGVVRPDALGDASVEGLFLDHYPGATEVSLERIAADAEARFAISATRVVHRCGFVPTGDAVVFAAAAAPHRRVAFQAADYMMDRLKTEALFWKREDGAAGSRWIEPTGQDRADRERWDDDAGN